ncbi:MAG: isoleucine--tRNA ligase [Candidatus Moranbacteria bacterium]|nr:isoleucine--tRNA ligase [Candidatus Moranbacteria bacterium]
MFKKVEAKVSFPRMEEEILKFWDEKKIFEQSVKKESPAGDFVFYEGPPTANGKPGLHHVLARSFKDIIPRYKTMKGYRVERKAGWDTHGLPVELQVEKALGLKSKQEIENIVPGDVRASIIEFNKQCKESVWEYRDLWEKLTHRMAYWVDMEHPYVTYENKYIESVWWQLAQIAKMKNAAGESFLYKGHKIVPYCYRCGTALSSHEVAQGYKVVKDLSVTVKFELVDEPGTFVLAWTTTPWTLPGNVALAVNENIDYVKLDVELRESNVKKSYIVAKSSINSVTDVVGIDVNENILNVLKNGPTEFFQIEFNNFIKTSKIIKGSDLVGKAYKPLFDYYAKDEKLENRERGWKIYHADFVTTEKGTGIAHEAPAFGEEDMELAKAEKLPIIHHVGLDGMFEKEVTDFSGMQAKPKDNPEATDVAIIKYLAGQGLLFSKEKYEHEYPFCWRCDTPLIYYAKPSWFIRMSELQEELVQNNEAVSWVPKNIKEGRFGEWLRGAKDWAISRERYWGTPLPIWECGKCQGQKVFSSIKELERLSGKTLEDVHKPYIDDIFWLCDCGGTMKRTPEVMDVWFDSGAMPLAQFSYPNQVSESVKKKIEEGKYFPADYICEAIDQTRGWFYTLHAVATLLHKGGVVKVGNAYKNVICLGHLLDGEGKKMSKSKGNVIDPFEMFDQFGADQLRWFMFSVNQPGLPKRFDLKGMRDVQNRVFRMLWNSYSFFTTYAVIDNWAPQENIKPSENLLDRWIVSELQVLIQEVDGTLDRYDVYSATQKIESFIDNLSNWYIRRSRKRFWKSEDDTDKEQAYQTLYTVLVTLSKLMAPFTPFLAEEMYKNLTGEQSVHLADYPVADAKLIDEKLMKNMSLLRELVTIGLQKRTEKKIKVRQPLQSLILGDEYEDLYTKELLVHGNDYVQIISEELNVKGFKLVRGPESEKVTLDWEITPELKLEGEMREVVRAIQEGRKKAGFKVEDRITVGYSGKEKVFQNEDLKQIIEKEVLATEVRPGMLPDAEYTETVKLDDEEFTFTLKRV